MFHKFALFLVILGAVHIGMTSWIGVDLIATVFGGLGNILNVLIGLSGVYMLLTTYTTLVKKTA